MSDMELYNTEKSELYYIKEQTEDEIFKLSQKLKRVKSVSLIEQIKEEIIYLCNDIKQINNRMNALYM